MYERGEKFDGGLIYEMKFCVIDKKVFICRLVIFVFVELVFFGLDVD